MLCINISMTNYHKKYMKYKTKYLNLLKGGTKSLDVEEGIRDLLSNSEFLKQFPEFDEKKHIKKKSDIEDSSDSDGDLYESKEEKLNRIKKANMNSKNKQIDTLIEKKVDIATKYLKEEVLNEINLEDLQESITRKIIQEIDLEDEAFNSFKNTLKKEIMEELDITPAKEDADLVIEDKEEKYTLEEVQEIIDYIRLVIFPLNEHKDTGHNYSLSYYFPHKYEFSYKNNLYLSFYCNCNAFDEHSKAIPVFIIDKIKTDNITLLLIFLYLITVMLTKRQHNYTTSNILFSDNFFKYDDFKILEPYLERLHKILKYPSRTNYKKYKKVYDKLNKEQKFKIEYTNMPLILNSEITYKYLTKTIENFPNIGNIRFQEKIQENLDYILN